MKKFLKGKLVAILSLVFILVVAGCGIENAEEASGKKNEEGVIKIGVIVAETGPASTLGSAQAKTVELLQKQLDEAGPIDGKKIQLIKQDYETNDTKAVVAMDKLISEDVVAVIGATQSSTTMAIIPKAIEKKLPLLTIAPIESESEYVYSMAQSTTVIAMPIVEYLKKNNIKNVAWVNASDGFGVTGKPAFEALAKENGIEIIAHEEFDATATDMTIQLTKVRKKDPEAIIVWSRTPGAGIIARNFKAMNFDIPMIQSTAAANQGFLEQVKDNNENIMVVGSKLSVIDQLPDSDQKEMLKAFSDAYKKEFNSEPDLFAAHLLDGVNVVVKAIKAGNVTSEDIHTYLQNDLGKYLGATGTFDFGVSQASPEPDGISVLSIENNDWKFTE
ncbi:ABC transporter substrate-binding protein [Lysinibacillus sp. G4S2]|uniref:ABC transporter substrate-binding protein n=1 Tax=Lysinibacillus sp. G4S2 TaxID=3055859 RepID=UPI0025A274ED|nr:ABC transporter substrate-binding protein [Lysinibacillus sp. G4S2]MDM5247951.1 ABC transporter substrate-binding protein [Lysinibacillus sp. G4S2]